MMMLPANILAMFFLSALLLALAPGPDNLFVLAQSAQHGKKAGLAVTAGLCTGLIVHTTAVVCGVAALIVGSPMAFDALKYCGAAYLLWLSWLSFRADANADASDTAAAQMPATPVHRLYGRGIVMNITNPKVLIFFLAFLPQFDSPKYGAMPPQILILGLLFIFATIIVFGAISLLAGTFGERLKTSRRARLVLNRLAGTLFAALAIRLIVVRS
jgi:threonine/homoserine/homoserine lactone efflux protein